MALDAGAMDALNCGDERTKRMIAPDLMEEAQEGSADQSKERTFHLPYLQVVILCVIVILLWQSLVPFSTWNLRTRERETLALTETEIPKRLAELGILKVTRIHKSLVADLGDGTKVQILVDPWREGSAAYPASVFTYNDGNSYQIRAMNEFEFGGDASLPQWSKEEFVRAVGADIKLLQLEVVKHNQTTRKIETAKTSWDRAIPASSTK